MYRKQKTLVSLFSLLLLLGQCKQRYVSPHRSPDTGYLVVEGFIAKGPTSFTLSRVLPLPGDSSIPMEVGAHVQVEGDDNSIYPLKETSQGTYSADTLPLNPAVQYRLRIGTTTGGSYLSDYAPFKVSPPIDSINWTYDRSSGLNIYANTHDPANSTHYYQWQFDETWQHDAAELSLYRYIYHYPIGVVALRADSEYVYHCWTNDVSHPVLLGNSTKLAQDVVYEAPLQSIPTGDIRIGILYTMLVRQYALTKEAYDFLTIMKSNTESLGSIFDAQPSALKGNIHCLNNPGELVVGYVSCGTIRQRRIWISESQLPGWNYVLACPASDTFVPRGKEDSFFRWWGYTPINILITLDTVRGWWANVNGCSDCTQLGGNNKKPAFWPN